MVLTMAAVKMLLKNITDVIPHYAKIVAFVLYMTYGICSPAFPVHL